MRFRLLHLAATLVTLSVVACADSSEDTDSSDNALAEGSGGAKGTNDAGSADAGPKGGTSQVTYGSFIWDGVACDLLTGSHLTTGIAGLTKGIAHNWALAVDGSCMDPVGGQQVPVSLIVGGDGDAPYPQENATATLYVGSAQFRIKMSITTGPRTDAPAPVEGEGTTAEGTNGEGVHYVSFKASRFER